MEKPTFKERFSYWFDNRMAGGSAGLIWLLAAVSAVIMLALACLVYFLGLGEDGFFAAAWDSMTTVVNAWMPYYEDGGTGYRVVMAVAAIAGLLVTSVLIGIVSSAIEEKITSLKRGNSAVLEEGHVVVLGFTPGEYTLLRQLVLAAGERPGCIVVAEDMARDEMEEYIRDNVEHPRSVRIICRTADIFDPEALRRCALPASRAVIVNPTEDARTVRALLAVSALIGADSRVRVGAILAKEEYQLPEAAARRHNVATLRTTDLLARIIAHSCTQPGLAETFREVFNFDGSEFYAVEVPGAAGLSFAALTRRLDGGVPVGLCTDDGIRLNPDGDALVREKDRVLVFAEDKDAVALTADDAPADAAERKERAPADAGRVIILGNGCCGSLPTVLRELPENVTDVVVTGVSGALRERAEETARQRPGMTVSFREEVAPRGEALAQLAEQGGHFVILSDGSLEEDEADLRSVFFLLYLRDLRESRGLRYNITAEMRREYNHYLAGTDCNTDFVVSSSMSSLFAAQLAESPELAPVFREILSNEGAELYLRPADELGCAGGLSTAEVRARALAQGCVVLGWLRGADGESVFNPPLREKLDLGADDRLIVIGEL